MCYKISKCQVGSKYKTKKQLDAYNVLVLTLHAPSLILLPVTKTLDLFVDIWNIGDQSNMIIILDNYTWPIIDLKKKQKGQNGCDG